MKIGVVGEDKFPHARLTEISLGQLWEPIKNTKELFKLHLKNLSKRSQGVLNRA